MKRFSLLPNLITAFGLSCGLFVIYKVMLFDGEKSLFSLLQSCAILLLIAAFADVADGALARLVKAESDFGGEFDSLSDSVTFGVAPPILVLKGLSEVDLGRLSNMIFIIAAMVYTLCGVLRLVRYNLKRKVKQPDDMPKPKRRYFIGLPIPAAAAAVLSACLILISPLAHQYFPLTEQSLAVIMMGVLFLMGYFMVSRWKFPSLTAFYFRVPSFNLVIAIGVFVALMLYGLLEYFTLVFFLLSWGYLALSLSLAVYRATTGRAITADEPENPTSSAENPHS